MSSIGSCRYARIIALPDSFKATASRGGRNAFPFRYYRQSSNRSTRSYPQIRQQSITTNATLPTTLLGAKNSHNTAAPDYQKRRIASTGILASRNNKSTVADPLARRPTKICDPYQQGGKPLDTNDVSRLLLTLEDGWTVDRSPDSDEQNIPPISVYREFHHADFLQGSKFLSHVASIGHNNNHYPHLSLERRLMKREKAWKVVSTVRLTTPTLGGLSYNDFHVAMLVDVEVGRRNVAELLLTGDGLMKSV